MTLTDLITSLRELEAKATPGEWFFHGHGQVLRVTTCVDLGHETFKERVCEFNNSAFIGETQASNNGKLVAESRNALPLLLNIIEIQRKALEACDEEMPYIDNVAAKALDAVDALANGQKK